MIMLAIPFGLVGIILAFWLHGLFMYGFFAVIGALGLAGDIKSLTVGRRKPLFIEKQSRSDLPEGVKEISLNYKIDEGEYENLKNFLRDLESNIRLFDVTSIQYHEKMKTYNMVLNTYYIED